jgi:hypothetical protein
VVTITRGKEFTTCAMLEDAESNSIAVDAGVLCGDGIAFSVDVVL